MSIFNDKILKLRYSLEMEKSEKLTVLDELISSGRYKEASKFLSNYNKELFLSDPIGTINNHLFVLIELANYDECFTVLENYKTYPYQNMEVEDYFVYISNALPDMIKKAIELKNKERNLDENGIDFSKYHSSNPKDLDTFLLQIFHSGRYAEYEREIENILKRNVTDHINFMSLCILYEINSDKLVDFQYKNSSFSGKLSEFHFPFSKDDKEFHTIKNQLNSVSKDVSVTKLAIELLGYLRLDLFPNHIDENDIPFIVEALIITAKKMFGQPYILINNERVKFFMNLLEEISNS
jgi:hypothetical protein